MRKVAQREDIQDLILDAVDVLLGRFGYKKMAIEDVARQVGIGKGTIYLHFPGKEELALAHVDRIAARAAAQMREAAASPEPLAWRLVRMLVLRVMVRFDSVRHYSQNLSELLSSVRTPLLALREGHFRNEAGIFEGVLQEGVTAGTLDCPDPRTTARVLIQSTNALLPFNLSPGELGKREEVKTEATRIADLLVRGLLPRPASVRH